MNWPILSVVTFLPLVGAVFIAAVRGNDRAAKATARWVALWATLVGAPAPHAPATASGAKRTVRSVAAAP